MYNMLIPKLLRYVMTTTLKHGYDESHGLGHSMNVLYYSHNIFNDEVIRNRNLKKYERIIYTSAIIHDMCDKKYVDTQTEIKNIEFFLEDKLEPYEIDATKQIISTMSYSYVKKNGFPKLNELQPAYNIVREADLLTGYDFDRSLIYNMTMGGTSLEQAYVNADDLFTNRVLKHKSDGLFTTQYALRVCNGLCVKALERKIHWKNIIKSDNTYIKKCCDGNLAQCSCFLCKK